uniref:Aprataxin and PNKP like factor n=1 Tax=Dicentrarchus labrax TaxID=13489 RepID=A0A8P4KFN8_DICLA
MSGFDLVPEDGGDPIHLPPGETVLGRGPFLRTHLNPCFVQSSPTEDPRPLQRDSWHPLRHGDLISLLNVILSNIPSRRNSQMFEDEEELPVSPAPDVEPPIGQDRGQTPPTPAAPSNQEVADRSLNKVCRLATEFISCPSLSR